VRQSVSILASTGKLGRHAVDVQAEPVWVSADPQRLDQIVANLITNAIRFTPPGGTIRVRVANEDAEAVVAVEDSGVGIPPEVLPRGLDLFAQSERRLDRAPAGLGLGLSLVRRLVELHGGRMQAFSEGPGLGSKFLVRLPRIEPVAGAGERPGLAASPPVSIA